MNDTPELMRNLVSYAIIMAGGGLALRSGHRLIRGVPKAGTSPERSIRQFVNYSLGTDPAGFESYVCLLDQAKQKAQSFDQFRQYWDHTRKALEAEVAVKLRNDDPGSLEYRWIIEQIIAANDHTFKVQLRIEAHSNPVPLPLGASNPFSRLEKSVPYRESFSLAKIGARWYLTSPFWSGCQKSGVSSSFLPEKMNRHRITLDTGLRWSGLWASGKSGVSSGKSGVSSQGEIRCQFAGGNPV
jgi:hypothetical protein